MKLSTDEIVFLKTYFSTKPVKKGFVFGSYSTGTASYDSDIDILVELDYSNHIGIEFIGMKLDIEDALHKKVDLISGQSVSRHIQPFIDKDKQLIYER